MIAPLPHRARERAHRGERTASLVRRMARTERGAADYEQLVHEVIEENMPVADSLAARYRRRGVPDEDLKQVAYMALVRVAHSYDPERGHDFLSYAVPSIRGEVRRYFRDQGWMIRPPRSIQEMQARVSAAQSELSTRWGHEVTAVELADEFGVPLAEVEEARAASGCFTPVSLDQTPGGVRLSIADQLGDEDAGVNAAEARVTLAPAVRRLTARERRVLDMRFFEGCTQQEIADEIGVTQMQVSRLLSALLEKLRRDLAGPTTAS